MPNDSHSPTADVSEASATPTERTTGWRSVFSLAPVYRTAQRLIGADSCSSPVDASSRSIQRSSTVNTGSLGSSSAGIEARTFATPTTFAAL
jgi:hypothetical protein